ncbi:MAG: MotE family protein [Alphaproteobacteria bacterium]
MFGPIRILPLLIIVSILAFSIRVSEVITGVSNLSNTAYAESKSDKKEDHGEEDGHDKGKKKKEDSHGKGHGAMEVVDDEMAEAPEWRDANDSNLDITSVKVEMFKDLAKRRNQIEKSEKDLHVREALLKAAEQEIDRKYQELTKLRKEIESLLDKQSEEEGQRIDSLVKIYEGMKPKDAARIFNTLDIDVLVSVISKMSERKISPVLAAMNPERVRTITIMLAEQKTLPSLR